MSLNVYLTMPSTVKQTGGGIFVRRNGSTEEVSEEEWREMFPDREPIRIPSVESNEVYDANITHNLNKMADEAGIYKALWRPEEIGIERAFQLIEPLTAGLALLRSDPERFKKHNPTNGWGSYDGLVGFVSAYLAACKESPDAHVRVSR